jgi:hypothetical protein
VLGAISGCVLAPRARAALRATRLSPTEALRSP